MTDQLSTNASYANYLARTLELSGEVNTSSNADSSSIANLQTLYQAQKIATDETKGFEGLAKEASEDIKYTMRALALKADNNLIASRYPGYAGVQELAEHLKEHQSKRVTDILFNSALSGAQFEPNAQVVKQWGNIKKIA